MSTKPQAPAIGDDDAAMTTFSTNHDLITYIDGLFGDLSDDETRRLAEQLSHEAHVDGLCYDAAGGDGERNWGPWLDQLQADRVLSFLAGGRETITGDS